MANSGVPSGKKAKGVESGKVSFLARGSEGGVPDGQSPGYGDGSPEESRNQLPSNAKVVKSAKSDLMSGMSQSRGPGGK